MPRHKLCDIHRFAIDHNPALVPFQHGLQAGDQQTTHTVQYGGRIHILLLLGQAAGVGERVSQCLKGDKRLLHKHLLPAALTLGDQLSQLADQLSQRPRARKGRGLECADTGVTIVDVHLGLGEIRSLDRPSGGH